MNFYNVQPQSNNNDNSSQILRNSAKNVLGQQNQYNGYNGGMYQNVDLVRAQQDNPIAENNFVSHQSRQSDFNQRQRQYNNSIISQSNQIKDREDNIRNIDRLNKINSEILRKQYIDQMNEVKYAQGNLKGGYNRSSQANNINNVNSSNINSANHPIRSAQNIPQNRLSSQSNPRSSAQPSRQINAQSNGQFPPAIQNMPPNLNNNNPYMNIPQTAPNYQMPNLYGMQPNPYGIQPNAYGMQANPYSMQANPYGRLPNTYSRSKYEDDSSDEEDGKSLKQVSSVITKQNDIMMNLLNKLNQQPGDNPYKQPYDHQRKEVDEMERYLKLHSYMTDLKYQQPQVVTQQQYGHNPYDSNNMVVQMMYQQQMMQALMYSQLLKNQNNDDSKNKQMTALDLLRQQQKEQNLEKMIKQLIISKGGNIEELQQKLDHLSGKSPQEDPKQKKKQPESDAEEDDEDDEYDDEDDDDEDDPQDDDEAMKAEKEKQRKAEVLKGAIQKVKRVWYRNAFAFKFLNQLKEREEERKEESLENIPKMQQISLKQGLFWSLVACEKAFSVIRSKPKENLDIVNDVDKLKSNVLEERITNICNLTQFVIDGLLEHTSHMPIEICKYIALYFQEKSYIPEGVISQLEIDRLEFNQNFGYLVNLTNDQKVMLTGVYFLVKMIILAVLAHPWQYQLNETKLKEEPITKTKLLLISSIIYHIFIEYIKKTINPIPNNITNIPIKMKPQPLPLTLLHELGNKTQPENGTRYNIVSGLIDYNSLLVIWTQKSDWKNQMLEKIQTLLKSIVDQAGVISDQGNDMERLQNIQFAQEDQKLLPESIRKKNFAINILPDVPIEKQLHLLKKEPQQQQQQQQQQSQNQ